MELPPPIVLPPMDLISPEYNDICNKDTKIRQLYQQRILEILQHYYPEESQDVVLSADNSISQFRVQEVISYFLSVSLLELHNKLKNSKYEGTTEEIYVAYLLELSFGFQFVLGSHEISFENLKHKAEILKAFNELNFKMIQDDITNQLVVIDGVRCLVPVR